MNSLNDKTFYFRYIFPRKIYNSEHEARTLTSIPQNITYKKLTFPKVTK